MYLNLPLECVKTGEGTYIISLNFSRVASAWSGLIKVATSSMKGAFGIPRGFPSMLLGSVIIVKVMAGVDDHRIMTKKPYHFGSIEQDSTSTKPEKVL
jgi:hypothetical protein